MFQGKLTFIPLVFAMVSGASHGQSLPTAGLGAELREAGTGRLRFLGFRVYDARLWITGQRFDSTQPFALGMKYAMEFSAEQIAKQSIEEIKRVTTGADASHDDWNERMKRVFPNVKAGDELVGANIPGVGARFFYNGRLVGEIADPAFAHAFFSIWLDPRTREPALRAALLGEK